MTEKKTRRTKTNAALSEAFWKLYIRKPISRITIKELSRETGIHRSSFYGHYDDIYELLRECEQILLDEMKAYMDFDRAREEGKTPLDIIILFYRKNLDKVTALTGEHGDPGFLIRLREQIIPRIMQYLTIPGDDKQSYYILDFIVTSMLTFLTSWYRREKTVPPMDILLSIRRAITNGCTAPLSEHARNAEAISDYIELL